VYKEGLVRFASNPYELNKRSIRNNFSHLTNFSLNKNNPEYRAQNDKFEEGAGIKGVIKTLTSEPINEMEVC